MSDVSGPVQIIRGAVGRNWFECDWCGCKSNDSGDEQKVEQWAILHARTCPALPGR